MPGAPPFVAGPVTVGPGMQTFQICANTDPLGNVAGSFNYTVTINGAGVGSITIDQLPGRECGRPRPWPWCRWH
jgi:hypothetical protein